VESRADAGPAEPDREHRSAAGARRGAPPGGDRRPRAAPPRAIRC